MGRLYIPVDVISLSNTDGEIHPLRVRAEQDQRGAIVGSVEQVLSRWESGTFGAETHTFLCRIRSEEELTLLELKYFVRSHRWYAAPMKSAFQNH